MIAKEKGLRLVFLSAKADRINSNEIVASSPADFVSLFKNASFVLCTSFHGTVFSIIFQKQFVCPIFRDNMRVESLLESLHIRERRVKSINEYNSLQPIDYIRVKKDLNSLREGTLNVWSSII